MRVAIVQETIDARRGGAETSTLEMARHLAKLGLDVAVVCRAAAGDLPVQEGVRIIQVPVRGVTRILRTYRFLRRVHTLRLSEQFDIIHAVTPCLAANVYQPRGGTYAETVARSLALVSSSEMRGLKWLGRQFNIRQRFLFRLELALLRRRQHRVFVAAVSDYVRRQVVDGYGFPDERTRVVFNGVDIAPLSEDEITQARTSLRAQLGVNGDTQLVLFAAHNFKLKGLAELIRASTLRPERDEPPQWVLVVAGRDRPDRYRKTAARFGVAQRVRFVGAETPMRQWYAAADALAHPTWYDPCSRVVLEALSVGLPVVTTHFNGAAEVMEAGQHGEVIGSPDDVMALSRAIADVLGRAAHGTRGPGESELRERLSMARHAQELRSLYAEVLAMEQSRRPDQR